jgi:hypothetical protein
MHSLEYRAGSTALEILRERGLRPNELEALILPAIGPKWLVLAGFDRALLEHRWFEALGGRVLLFGSSVGAWRALALASRDPLRAHRELVDTYCAQHFTHDDGPQVISDAYRRLIRTVFSDDDLAFAIEHPRFDIAMSAVRVRGPLGLDRQAAQALMLGGAVLLNAVSSKAQALFFERVTFETGAQSNLTSSFLGERVGVRAPLTTDNVHDVALASGTVPMYMQSVRNIAHAPPGSYIDGGFSDYHVNQGVSAGRAISVLFLPQRRIVPTWLDKFVPWRRPPSDELSRLLLVYPSVEFVRSLPGAAIPTRHDFKTFVDAREERIGRWRTVAARSAELGQSFVDDVASGAIASRALPL